MKFTTEEIDLIISSLEARAEAFEKTMKTSDDVNEKEAARNNLDRVVSVLNTVKRQRK